MSETPKLQAALKYKIYMFLCGSHLPINKSQKTLLQVILTRWSTMYTNVTQEVLAKVASEA